MALFEDSGKERRDRRKSSASAARITSVRRDSFYNKRPRKSCGCKSLESIRAARTVHGASVKNGGVLFSTYIAWQSMLWRCYNKKRKDYPRYGGRGIKVCEQWRADFPRFLKDMGLRPRGMSLDRKNNERGYDWLNCRWATPTQQARNKSSNHLLEFKGERKTITEWSETTGIQKSTLWRRIQKGWSAARVITTPLGCTSKYA